MAKLLTDDITRDVMCNEVLIIYDAIDKSQTCNNKEFIMSHLLLLRDILISPTSFQQIGEIDV